jgi:prepilin-type N-terminal cleavage/methylation domain-containing protein
MRSRSRRGLTLWELLLCVTLMAIVAAIVAGRNGRQLIGTFGAEADARRVGLALLQAKRRTISTGTTHGVQFTSSGGNVTSCSVVSIVSGVSSVVDGPITFTTDLVVTTSHTQMTYDFEGKAGAAYWVQMAGPNATWRIDVIPITGAISTTKL